MTCKIPKPFGSAEYQKDYKPQNNSACGCNHQLEPPPIKTKIRNENN